MTRSKSGIFVSTTRLTFAGSILFFTDTDLATVAPCDDESEDDVKAAEAGAEDDVRCAEGDEGRQCAEKHEGDAHDRAHQDRERGAADQCRPVEQQTLRRDRRIR